MKASRSHDQSHTCKARASLLAQIATHMLEFKHPAMTASVSVLDFFRASRTLKQPTSESKCRSKMTSKSPAKNQRSKGIEAACVLPTVIFLGTEMFTPAEKEFEEKPSLDVPSIVITADGEDDLIAVELSAS